MQFSAENKSVKFVFPGQEDIALEKQAVVMLRMLTNDVLRDIMNKTKEHHVDLKPPVNKLSRPEVVQYDTYDDNAMYELTWDYCIESWVNIEVNDEPLLCTKENKLLLLGSDSFFASCLLGWKESIEDALSSQTEEIRKNSQRILKGFLKNLPVLNVEKSIK